MFDSIGWGEVLVLIIAGLFIVGPERLPSAAARLGRTIHQVKEYATGAREQLRSELGPEFDELRKPLEDLRGLRNFDARSAVNKHLFDGDNPLDDLTNDKGNHYPGNGHASSSGRAKAAEHRPLDPEERPPFDPDAT